MIPKFDSKYRIKQWLKTNHDILFIAKLVDIPLTNTQIVEILWAMNNICKLCWDDTLDCLCWNDE